MKIENYEDEFIVIEHLESKPKTEVYEVNSKCTGYWLGQILWYPQWRHYVFMPANEYPTVHSDRCLFAIGDFVKKLNTNHKK